MKEEFNNIHSDKEQIFKLFVNNIDEINLKNDVGWTPLYRTIVADNSLATEILLEMGADPNVKSNMGETPLFQAVEMGLHEAIQVLLNYKADPNLPSNDGRIPLHNAVAKKELNIINLLLQFNSNPNAKNKLYSQSPLHLAMKNSVNISIVDLLIKHGGDLNLKDKYDKTPMDYIQLEETKIYILNLLNSKNTQIIQSEKKEETGNGYVNENKKDSIKNNATYNFINSNNNNLCEKNESVARFLTPSKDELFEKEFFQNTESKTKFESDLSIIEKANMSKLNNYNLEHKIININNSTNKENQLNLNNINSNFFSGIKNNLNLTDFLTETDKNYKLDLSTEAKRQLFPENNMFDFSGKKNRTYSCDPNQDNSKDNLNLNKKTNKKREENKNNENDKYTIDIRDSNKFSLSDFQIKEMMQNANINKNNEFNNEINLINKQNKRESLSELKKDLNQKEKSTSKNNLLFNLNDYSTFENKNIDFDKIDLTNNYNIQNTHEDAVVRLSQNTNNIDINLYNTNNTNNFGEKPKTPKSVFSPMTFFKNNNTNSKSDSNSKYLLSERDKNAYYEKDQYNLEGNNNNFNNTNNLKLKQINSLKPYNSNSNFHNTLGSNTNSNNLIFSDRKFLGNDNEYILEDDETSNLNNLKNNLKNINILDSEGKEENDFKKKNSSNNNNKYNNYDHNIRNNQINKNLNKINFENFTLNSKNDLEARKENNSPSNYESDSFEEKPNKKLNKKCSKKGLKCLDKIKELKGSEFSCDEKIQNTTNDNFTVKNKNFANSNRSSYNKVQNPSETNLRNKSDNSILNNHLKESNERLRKELMEQDNDNENVESEMISYINADNINNNFYYNEKDLINGNIIKTGNYDSFISRDHSRNSFLFLTNRQSADNNRSYCKSVNNNEVNDRIINVHKSNNSEKKNVPELSQHNLEGTKNEISESNNKNKSFNRLQKENKGSNSNSNLPNIPKSRKNSLLDTEKLKFKKAARIKNNNILAEEPKNSNHNYNDSTSFDFTEREKMIQKLLSPRDQNNNNNANNNINSENDFENNYNENEISIIKKKMENVDHNVKKDSIKSNPINKIHLSNKKFYEDSNMTNNPNNLNSNKKNSNHMTKEPKLFSASVVSPSNIDINYKVTENSYSNSLRDINNILNTESANNTTLKKETIRNETCLKSPHHLIFAESEKKVDLKYQNNIDETRIKDFNKSSKKININLNQSNKFTDLNNNFSTKNKNGKCDNLRKNLSPNDIDLKTKINFFNTEENISCLLPEEETSENENVKNNIINYNENTNENYSGGSYNNTNNNSSNNIYINNKQNLKFKKDNNFPQLNIKTNHNFYSPIASHNNSNFTNTTNHNIFNFNPNNINELRNSRKNCISEDNKKTNSSSNLNKMASKNFSLWKNSLNGKNINTKSLVLNNISPKNFSYGNLNNLSTNKNSNSNSKIYGGALSNKNFNFKSQNNSNLGFDTLTNSYILSNKARDNYFNFFSTENKDAFKNSLYTDNTNYVNNFINTNSNNNYTNELNSRINSTKNIDLKKSEIRSNNNKSNIIYNPQSNNQFNFNGENIENMQNAEYINDYINADFDEQNNNFNPINCISKNQALLIHNWLFSMNLAQYYNNFIENGLINLESIITRYLECELNINNNFNIIENYRDEGIDQMFCMSYKKLEYEDFEKIGIRKPGHIYKILTRIEFDAKLINQNLSFLVKSQINPFFPNFENNLDVTNSTSSLRVSDAKVVCCSLKQNKLNANKLKNEFDLQKFLEKYKLKKYERNFAFNGFDSLEYIFLQFFSSFKFDEEILENKLHIYEQSDRIKILVCLMKELKEINVKLGLNVNLTALFDDEMNNIYEEENLNIYDNRKEEEGCKACLIF